MTTKENLRQAIYLGVNSILSEFEKEFNNEADYTINKPLLKSGDNLNKDLYFPVNNSDYRRWRENSKMHDASGVGFGRDMILFSEIEKKRVKGLSVIVRIEDRG